MWICPTCGEHNEAHFQQCWKCVSDTLPLTTEAEPPPRQLRSFVSVLGRALVGFLVGALTGVAVSQRQGLPLETATVNGLCFGTICGVAVGCLVWVVFPYQSTNVPPPENPNHPA